MLGQPLDAVAERAPESSRYSTLGDVPMDEARASCVKKLSEPHFHARSRRLVPPARPAAFRDELRRRRCFRALANAAKLTLHLRVEEGRTPTT